jgi:voltage-gated potassium channel
MHSVIFESDSRAGRLFDVVLIGLILASVAVVILDSIASVHARFGATLHAFECASCA